MTAYHEPMYLSDVLLTEVARGWTTQNVKIKTDTALAIGTVLFYVQGENYFVGDNKGNGVVAGILADNVKASDDVQTGLAIVRGAVVATENLIFPNDVSDDEKKSAVATLNAMGIMTQGEILPVATDVLPVVLPIIGAEPVPPTAPPPSEDLLEEVPD